MWTVQITDKQIVSGMLRINFAFSNGTDSFTENYETRAGQNVNWLNHIIYQRIENLNALIEYNTLFEPERF